MKWLIGIVGILLTGGIIYVNYDSAAIMPHITYGEWVTGGASQRTLIKTTKFEQEIKKYPALVANLNQSVPLPGLQGAWTLSLANEQLIKINTFDIQGVTTSPTQIFISAYDSSKRGQSIIYVLDKKSGAYLKSLILSGAPHAGGLTYDYETKILWVTGNRGKQAMINGIGQNQIDHYDFTRHHQAIHYDLAITLPDIPKASAITLTEQHLWVGYNPIPSPNI
jgi:hypothetical protein